MRDKMNAENKLEEHCLRGLSSYRCYKCFKSENREILLNNSNISSYGV